jgi:hypothetical protein
MTGISSTYFNALLADAVYAEKLVPAMRPDALRERLQQRMTPVLASLIAENFEVVAVSPTSSTGSGFQAVVWRGRADTPLAGLAPATVSAVESEPVMQGLHQRERMTWMAMV